MLLLKLVQTGILEVSNYRFEHKAQYFIFFSSGGFGRWTSDACVVVSKHGERPVKCKCNQPAHFGLLFVSTSKYVYMKLMLTVLLIITYDIYRI